MRPLLGPVALLVVVSVSPTLAHEGGIPVPLCTDQVDLCTEDILEIVFENGTSTLESVAVGERVPIAVVLDTRSPQILGYSFAVSHDEAVLRLEEDSVTTAGTVIDPASPDAAVVSPFFDVTSAVPGGFISAVVLSFLSPAQLPVGRRSALCRATYTVTAPTACTVIEFVSGRIGVPGAPPTPLILTVDGESRIPAMVVHGQVGPGPCPELCGDGTDNDDDGDVDCDDDDCSHRIMCRPPEDCEDGVDNDGDTLADCDDRDCVGAPACQEIDCDDGIDNNGDGFTDCEDPDCLDLDPCREICDDGVDNNGDGAVDCDDRTCESLPECEIPPERCEDGADNDGDGLVDCEDADCRFHAACRVPEICDDGIDDDRDGLVDCRDRRCSGVGRCPALPGAGGGVVETFCQGRDDCVDDTLEVVFAGASSTFQAERIPGEEIPVTIVTETRSFLVQGWSYGVQHDPDVLELDPDSVTTDGTVVDEVAIPPNFNVTRAVEGGFISALVLAFIELTELPVGERNSICRATYRVGPTDQSTLIELVHDELPRNGQRPVSINITTNGRSGRPRTLRHGLISFAWDGPEDFCNDGEDGDGDGLVDCDDPDCAAAVECQGGNAAAETFRRGDTDGDGRLTVSDARIVILVSIGSIPPRFDCEDALDTNDDERVNIVDALPLLAWIFQRGEPLPSPFLACGQDADCAEPSPACP